MIEPNDIIKVILKRKKNNQFSPAFGFVFFLKGGVSFFLITISRI